VATVSRKDGTPSAMAGCMMTWIEENQPISSELLADKFDIKINSASSVLRRMRILGWITHNDEFLYVVPPEEKADIIEENRLYFGLYVVPGDNKKSASGA